MYKEHKSKNSKEMPRYWIKRYNGKGTMNIKETSQMATL
jgi:hypothetical protein